MDNDRKLAPVLMVVGTASSVGKSVLVTALCRIFAQDAIRVAPFKAQNMSNNAAVTPDGLEIGRAQAEQAAAAGLEPEVAMNPILLKPQGDRTSHVILDGRPAGVLTSADFIRRKRDFWPHVERALHSLRERYDLVVVEGAGSPAEPNLQATDIVNMRVACHAGAVTLLVGDIDRGACSRTSWGRWNCWRPRIVCCCRGSSSIASEATPRCSRLPSRSSSNGRACRCWV